MQVKLARAPALLLAALALALPARQLAQGTGNGDADADEESDSAPFVMVVEHPDNFRCGASLVSLRSAVTSAECTRERPPPRAARPHPAPSSPRAHALWALAAAALTPSATPQARKDGTRRVVRVAVAHGTRPDALLNASLSAEARSWWRSAHDLAVLELEAPFGDSARPRPILMAAQAADCEGAARECQVVRAVRAGRRASLHVVSLRPAPRVCAAAAPDWPAVARTALCLDGHTLCSSDWGAGVVCDGKLCGVLSRSQRAAGGAAGGAADGAAPDAHECGSVHLAQSVARWRHFLHCAHALRDCSKADCQKVCVERRLDDPPVPRRPPPSAPAAPRAPPLPPPDLSQTDTERRQQSATLGDHQYHSASSRRSATRTRTHPHPHTHRAPHKSTHTHAHAHSPVPARDLGALAAANIEFDLDRPDVKAPLTALTSSPPVYLKGGEYGDNAAEYGVEEPAPAATQPGPAPGDPPPPPPVLAPPTFVPLPAPPPPPPTPLRPRTQPAPSSTSEPESLAWPQLSLPEAPEVRHAEPGVNKLPNPWDTSLAELPRPDGDQDPGRRAGSALWTLPEPAEHALGDDMAGAPGDDVPAPDPRAPDDAPGERDAGLEGPGVVGAGDAGGAGGASDPPESFTASRARSQPGREDHDISFPVGPYGAGPARYIDAKGHTSYVATAEEPLEGGKIPVVDAEGLQQWAPAGAAGSQARPVPERPALSALISSVISVALCLY